MKVPVLPAPSMSWGDSGSNAASAVTPAAVTPSYPAVGGNSSGGSTASAQAPAAAPAQAVAPQAVSPQAATPGVPSGDTRSLPWGTILFVAIGGLIGMVGRTVWDRGGSMVAARSGNQRSTEPKS